MVVASVLSYLASSCQYQLKLIAVHLDYGNRPESAAEADFVRRFCHELGNVDFRCRRIDEVTRGVTARDAYEKISRTVRYDMYRRAVEYARDTLIGASEGDDVEIGVVLGHHRGDLRENVLSNALRGCGPLDLSGMTGVSRNDGVTLYRPLLSLEKTTIFDYAHRFGVPYLKDTTPHWSTRGKLRNKLLPLLEEIYGEGSLGNLGNLAVESDACRNLVHSIALGPFLAQIRRKPMGISFATHLWKAYDLFFWKIVLREALHSVGLGMFSEKSVVSFLERVRAPTIREGWLQCRKDYAVYLRRDGQAFVLFPKSFPWGKSDRYVVDSDTVPIPHTFSVGPWRVSTSIQRISSDVEKEALLARKAVPDMDAFMEGCIEYYVEARTWKSENRTGPITETSVPRPLVFASFTKSTRPLAWKNADVKLQETLPLLSCDPLSRSALRDPLGSSAVHADADAMGTLRNNPLVLVKVALQVVASEASPMHNA
jgi:tRNA(Ile)-lysidine synthase TilS/MesJ